MSKLFRLIFLIFSFVFPFFLNAAEIQRSGNNHLNVDEYLDKKLYVEFESSQKLTSDFKQRFELLGFKLVSSPEDADVSLKIMAGYFFQRPHAKQQYVDFGKVIEQANADIVKQKDSESTRMPKVELAPLVQGLRGNLSVNMVIGVGIVDTILSLSGARSWFNKLVSGDERGVCLGTQEMCKDWKKYDQQMRFAAVVTPKAGKEIVIRVQAVTKDEELVPDQMFHEGMGELTARLFPSQQTTNVVTEEKTSSDSQAVLTSPASVEEPRDAQ